MCSPGQTEKKKKKKKSLYKSLKEGQDGRHERGKRYPHTHSRGSQRSGLEPLWRSSDKAARAKAVKRANNMQQQQQNNRQEEKNRNYAAIIFYLLLLRLLNCACSPFFPLFCLAHAWVAAIPFFSSPSSDPHHQWIILKPMPLTRPCPVCDSISQQKTRVPSFTQHNDYDYYHACCLLPVVVEVSGIFFFIFPFPCVSRSIGAGIEKCYFFFICQPRYIPLWIIKHCSRFPSISFLFPFKRKNKIKTTKTLTHAGLGGGIDFHLSPLGYGAKKKIGKPVFMSVFFFFLFQIVHWKKIKEWEHNDRKKREALEKEKKKSRCCINILINAKIKYKKKTEYQKGPGRQSHRCEWLGWNK